MWHSIAHPNSRGQIDWSCLALLVVTNCSTLTQGSKMGEQVKHPRYGHIWVPNHGEQWQTSPASLPPTLTRDHFENDSVSIGVVHLLD